MSRIDDLIEVIQPNIPTIFEENLRNECDGLQALDRLQLQWMKIQQKRILKKKKFLSSFAVAQNPAAVTRFANQSIAAERKHKFCLAEMNLMVPPGSRVKRASLVALEKKTQVGADSFPLF